jgi:hypothetical protein
MKIRPLGAELFPVGRRTDRQTDVTKLVVAFCNFAKGVRLRTSLRMNAVTPLLSVCAFISRIGESYIFCLPLLEI